MATPVQDPKPAVVRQASHYCPDVASPTDGSQRPLAALQPLTPQEVASVQLTGDEHPRNWSNARKWKTTVIISLMGFISPLGASILVPGSMYVDRGFHLQSRTLSVLPVSLFVLGLGVGPFVLAPISEMKGRQPVYVVTSLVFIFFNIGTAFSQDFVTLNVLRFMAGAAGSAGPSLGAGSIGDMFEPRERGRAQSLYGLGPLLGPVLGNVIGGFVAQGDRDWRWLLYTLTMMSAFVFIAIIFALKETYQPVLLRKKQENAVKQRLADIQKQLDEQAGHPAPEIAPRRLKQLIKHYAAKLIPSADARTKLKQAHSRPFRLLFTNPICAIFSMYLGFCYGIIFLFLTQHPLLFQRRDDQPDAPPPELPTYNWTLGLAGLSYFGLGLGFIASALTNVALQDSIYTRLVLTDGKLGWILFRDRLIIQQHVEQQRILAMGGGGDVEKNDDEAKKSPSGKVTKAVLVGQGAAWSTIGNPAMAPASTKPKKGRPEYRLPLCFVGMLILPCGLLCFGWSAESKSHFIVPLLGSFLTGYATILCFQTILVYLVDAFIPFSASATACAVLVRSILAAAFPLMAEEMFEDLGYGWSCTLLAGVALAGAPVPLILYRYGEGLRSRYKFSG